MDIFKSLRNQIFSVRPETFSNLALQVFRFQASENVVYAEYISHLGIEPEAVKALEQIPYLPIEFFKSHRVVTGNWDTTTVFESSGTTGSNRSRHFVHDERFYLENCKRIFRETYSDPASYVWLALLPSYLERTGSSLVSMADHFIQQSVHSESGFYLRNYEELLEKLRVLQQKRKPVILLGVTFALLELAERMEFPFPELIVMETGGMKGMRRELVRGALHDHLCSKFGVKQIHSEYGMTELFSQAYAKREGIFRPGSTMRVFTRDVNDPFYVSNTMKTGALNVIDLANVHSCAFIETKDMGSVEPDGQFRVLGRMDNSDIRGCNLLLVE